VNNLLKPFINLQNAWFALRTREEGQTMAEYGVVLALITAAVAGVFLLLGDAIIAKVQEVTDIL
jgi:Flp pilus assembly pilin Flp